MSIALPRLLLAAPMSGSGKTTITAGLIAALSARGLAVAPFKCGPDYIDPSYHALAAGRPCANLDAWLVPPEHIPGVLARRSAGADLALIEGVMGLFDGYAGDDDTGSSAHIARLTGAPVVIVLDVRAMARTAAALVAGLRDFDPRVRVVGVILNRVGSPRHAAMVRAAIEGDAGLPVLGALLRDEAITLPERHLGLVPTAEAGRWQAWLDEVRVRIEASVDLEALLGMARAAPPLDLPANALAAAAPEPRSTPDHLGVHASPPRSGSSPYPEPPSPARGRGGQGGEGRRRIRTQQPPFAPNNASPGAGAPIIAVSRDEAFSFLYDDNLDLLRDAGATIAFFSPLRDTAPPADAGALYLCGGFPELYAAQLSANESMRAAIRAVAARALPIYAECGGLMYLTETLIDADGRAHPMVGLLPGRSVMTPRLTLGYRTVRANGASWLWESGETVRGHEFHYSVWEDRPAELPWLYTCLPDAMRPDARPEGACTGNVLASYVHIHWLAAPHLAARFIAAARRQCDGAEA